MFLTGNVHFLPSLIHRNTENMLRGLLLFLFFIPSTSAGRAAPGPGANDGSPTWQTLSGKQPKVVARGGFSGLYPESSIFANSIVKTNPQLILLCNVQLTKDNIGICRPDVEIGNSTSIEMIFPNETKTYKVNEKDVTGYFSIDYTFLQLTNVTAIQNVLKRTGVFDLSPIPTIDDVRSGAPATLWVNVKYAKFYEEHKMSMEDYFEKLSLRGITYLSSTEIGFLKAMSAKKPPNVKLFFVFRSKDAVEPTTNKTYGSFASNLAALKPMVAGIVAPKEYIWPVEKSNYLAASPTTLVADAHKLGLEVYASGFANDNFISYNYSYDPTEEYLNFIRNGQFSVDGFITDFPPTAMDAVECFATFNSTQDRTGRPLIITRSGASGEYAGSSDLAYQQAVDDEADIIDCSVQMSNDGVAFCMGSPDLTADTTAASTFIDKATTIQEVQSSPGIFSFDLSWSDIQTLQPRLSGPFEKTTGLKRNPAVVNKGKFVKLDEFLEFAKSKSVPGILISLENVAYLASKKGLDVVTTASKSLSKASFDKQSTQQVFIQSEDTSVLDKFKNVDKYKRVLMIKKEVSDIPKDTAAEIKKYADAVTLTRYSIIPTNEGFTLNYTDAVQSLQSENLSVFVSTLYNEYVTLAFDYFADPIVEISTYFHQIGVNGTVTEYPRTASKYMKNPCSDLNNQQLTHVILPIVPGSLLNSSGLELPAPSQPRPSLAVKDIGDPPLPAVTKVEKPPAAAPPPHSSALSAAPNICLSFTAAAVVLLSLMNPPSLLVYTSMV
ncbi:Glycerophosphodiester phosphodiesterase GDPDL6 [Linum grandiflorum]